MIQIKPSPSLIDEQQRQRALDPSASFIVQAPAGSGKTELLMQRYLVLLESIPEVPEQIIAITFTRKAAAEMKQRILQALRNAEGPLPENPAAQKTWHLANKVLRRDQKEKWQLLQNPSRLQIMTFDALAAQIAACMPIHAGWGAHLQVHENAMTLYEEAARLFLLQENHPPAIQKAIQLLLIHLDNHLQHAITRLAEVLAHRAQWLPLLLQNRHDLPALRETLEDTLYQFNQEQCETLQSLFPLSMGETLHALAVFAGEQLRKTDAANFPPPNATTPHPKGKKDSTPLRFLSTLAATSTYHEYCQHPEYWKCLSFWLLKTDGEWYKRVTIANGFPKECTVEKKQMEALLQHLENQTSLRLAFLSLRQAPPTTYSDAQWELLSVFTELLPLLVAELYWVFKKNAAIDFPELNIAALRALGEAGAPSDLALALDYKIQHLLVDEFQDTSTVQFYLLEKLVEGWQINDGRTLFLVGDPMQSIYRFRHAEVGLFVQVQETGIGALQPELLILRQNFRATDTLVSWINDSFSSIFPARVDKNKGAIPFSHSAAFHPKSTHAPSFVRMEASRTAQEEAQTIVQRIHALKQQHPEGKIAILTRARAHLQEIIPTLLAHKIPFHAVEIYPLLSQPIAQDLLMLTHALLHFADSAAWFALLRAPWCGLRLVDLERLAAAAKESTLWQTMTVRNDVIQTLTADGQQRLQRITACLQEAYQHYQRLPLAQWLRMVWLHLGGPACCLQVEELAVAHDFFEKLAAFEEANPCFSIDAFDEALEKHFTDVHPQALYPVAVMTIHKAKGLEFDHVILPGLHHSNPGQDPLLLRWQEWMDAAGQTRLFLSPIKGVHHTPDPLYTWLGAWMQQQLHHETTRLFYVACTRAKHSLFLSAVFNSEDPEVTPPAGSFLAHSWGIHKAIWMQRSRAESPPPIAPASPQENAPAAPPTPPLRRLDSQWQLPPGWKLQNVEPYQPRQSWIPLWEPHNKSSLGTVAHEMLQGLYRHPSIHSNAAHWKTRLLATGLDPALLHEAWFDLEQMSTRLQKDPRAQWILQGRPDWCKVEYPMTAAVAGQVQHFVMDRCFIENGVLWIIDYKTARPDAGMDPREFLETQKKLHFNQLEQYAAALQLQFPKLPIRLGLYFPMHAAWIEWEASVCQKTCHTN